MESTVALIWASISLSLFAKPQLLLTTKLWSLWPLTVGLMLEFCGLPLETPVRITTQRNSAKLGGRENISVWHSNIFKSVVLRRWSIGKHWLGIKAVRRKAEIKLFIETRTFSGLVNTRKKSNLVSGLYVMNLRTERRTCKCFWENGYLKKVQTVQLRSPLP